jgi:Cu/Zn superoxide dismutase
MMNRITPIPGRNGTTSILLLAVLILALVACGGEGDKTSTETAEETTNAGTSGEETTTAKIGGGGAVPSDILSVTLALIPYADSGVSGTAIFTDTSTGIEATVNVQNLPDQPDTEHLAHIHEGGTCADDRAGNAAEVKYPLNPVVTGQGGEGFSTTEIPDATVATLFSDAPKYVDVHAATTEEEMSPSISCADIYTRTGGD